MTSRVDMRCGGGWGRRAPAVRRSWEGALEWLANGYRLALGGAVARQARSRVA